LKKKENREKRVVARAIESINEDSSHFEAPFSIVSCYYSNIVSSVGWYVDSGDMRHMTYDRSLFSKH